MLKQKERPTKLWRVQAQYNEDGIKDIIIFTIPIIKYTPHGYWIQLNDYSKKRWVSAETTKRYAYPTKKQSLFGFIKRREQNIRFLLNSIKNSERLLKEAKKMYDEE